MTTDQGIGMGRLVRPAVPRRESGGRHSVLVVDDSPVVRRLVTEVLQAEPGFEVVGEAADGVEAVEMARRIRPDSIVLDLRMPGMDGWEVLVALESVTPQPRVVVFANVNPADLGSTSERVRRLGAELVVKPTGVADIRQARSRIRQTLLVRLARSAPGRTGPNRRSEDHCRAVVIASSTGGPVALEEVLSRMGPLPVPAFVVQHISAGFSKRLARQLNRSCRSPVYEAEDGQRPEAGHIYLSPGGRHLEVGGTAVAPTLRLTDAPPVNSCRPSADVLFSSAADLYGGRVVAVVLTGIGEDGLLGCRTLASLGARILVQDEPSSVVWGMPGAVAEAGLADEILPITELGTRLELLVRGGRGQNREVGR